MEICASKPTHNTRSHVCKMYSLLIYHVRRAMSTTLAASMGYMTVAVAISTDLRTSKPFWNDHRSLLSRPLLALPFAPLSLFHRRGIIPITS